MDYKFILILAICLILYYIYNETEKLKKENERINQKIVSLNNTITKMNNIKYNQFTAYPKKVNINHMTKYKDDNVEIDNKKILNKTTPIVKKSTHKNKETVHKVNLTENKSLEPYSIERLPIIEDDKTTISENFNSFSNKKVIDVEIDDNDDDSPELAIYSNDNDNTSLGMTDIIDSHSSENSQNLNSVVGDIISDIEGSSQSENDSINNQELNIILNSITDENNESIENSDDSDIKKKIPEILKMDEIPKININESLQKILDEKDNINNDELNFNVDIDEIVNESSNTNYKLKTLKRKKLADLQAIAVKFQISLNKVHGSKLKNKTKVELCKEIVAKQN